MKNLEKDVIKDYELMVDAVNNINEIKEENKKILKLCLVRKRYLNL